MKVKKTVLVQPVAVPNSLTVTNSKLLSIYQTLKGLDNIRIQQECIKMLMELVNDSSNSKLHNESMSMLSYIYLFTPLKHPIRRTLMKFFNGNDNKKYLECMCKHLKNKITKLNGIPFLSDRSTLDDLINGLYIYLEFENLTENIDELVIFLNYALCNLFEVTREGMNHVMPEIIHYYLQHLVRIALSAVQKCALPELLSLKLLSTSFKVCTYEHASFEVRANSTHMMLIVSKSIPNNFWKVTSVNKENHWLEFICLLNEKQSELKNLEEYKSFVGMSNSKTLESFKVCIILAVLKTVPLETLQKNLISGQPVVLFFLNELLESAKRVTGKPAQILEVTQAILLVCDNLKLLTVTELQPIFADCLSLIFSHLDHYIHTIRSNTTAIFIKLIKIAKEHAKEGNTCLEDLIIAEVFNLQDVGNIFYQALEVLSAEIGCMKILEKHASIPSMLLSNLDHSDLASEICGCYKNLMTLHIHEAQPDEWIKHWVGVLLPFLREEAGKAMTYYQNLFIETFKLKPVVLKILLSDRVKTDNEILAFLGCMHYLRKQGINLPIKEVYPNVSNKTLLWRDLIHIEMFQILKTYHNDLIRISILALIIESHKTTEIFTKWEFDFLISYFEKNMAVLSANVRQQMVSLGRKMFSRYLESINVLQRSYMQITEKLKLIEGKSLTYSEDMKKEELKQNLWDIGEQLSMYKTFWVDLFLKVLTVGLHPGACYSRRASCLEFLMFSIYVIERNEWEKVWNEKHMEHLKMIIEFDTYESNKDMATKLCQKLGYEKMLLKDDLHVKDFFNLTLKYITSIKPAETLAGVHMLSLALDAPHINRIVMDKIQSKKLESVDALYVISVLILERIYEAINVASENLKKAAANKPLHGLFLALRYLVKSEYMRKGDPTIYRKIITQIIDLCFMILPIIFEVVCDSSPEGYLPNESNNDDDDATATAQMLLVYTWRTAKETSLLLGEISQNLPIIDADSNNGLIEEQQMVKIGDFFIDFLMKAKHRGAFEQGYIGFSNYCRRLWTSHNKNLKKLPEMLLRKIVKGLQDHVEFINACATRRSAGLPFMLQAILTTEPNTQGNKLFHYTINVLINIATDIKSSTNEQRIHSMNILKALHKHYQLGELVAPYVSQGVMIAITGLSSKNWSIRNSATLLFSALMTKMFGVLRSKTDISSKNKLTAHVFFMRYPELYEFLLEQLSRGSREANCPSLYAILLIFGRLYPSKRDEDSKYKLNRYLPFIELCLSNSVFQIRDLAAAASVSIIPVQELNNYILKILQMLENVKENHRHGLLLQLHYLLQTISNKEFSFNSIKFPPVSVIADVGKTTSHLSGTLFIEIFIQFIKRFKFEVQHPTSKTFFASTYCLLLKQEIHERKNKRSLSTSLKKYKVARCFLQLFCGINASNDKNSTKFLLKSLFALLISDDETLAQFSLNVVNYLKMGDERHNLYVAEELEVSYYENKLVDLMPERLKKEFKEKLEYYIEFYLLYALGKVSEFQSNEVIASIFVALCSCTKLLDNIFNSPNLVLSTLIALSTCRNELVVSAALSVIGIYVHNANKHSKTQIEYSGLLTFLEKCASPWMSRAVRLSACDFFLKNKDLFYYENCILTGNNLIKAWQVVMTLAEDDDKLIRKRISHLTAQPFNCTDSLVVLPTNDLQTLECSKREILRQAVATIPDSHLLHYLLLLIFRSTKNEEDLPEEYESSDVFDRGAVNIHSEEPLLALNAQRHLRNILWRSDCVIDGRELSCSCLKLIDAFTVACIPKETKIIACKFLKQLASVCKETHDINVIQNIFCSLNENLDIVNLKEFFEYIFKPLQKR